MPEDINKKKSAKLDHYFNDVEVYSKQHISDIEKFERFLETMKDSLKNSADQKAYIEFQNTYQSFNRYMNSHGVMLTDNEKNEITAITGSKLSPVSTKRMMEDLIHKIKSRHDAEKRSQQEYAQVMNEIEELKSTSGIFDWFKLTKFAVDYGTITLFSHRLKDSSFKILREKIFPWQGIIENIILPVMNKEYYLLSTLEYNALDILLKLKEPLMKLVEIKLDSSYDTRLITRELDDLSDVYLIILKNAAFIDSSFQKAIKNQPPEHGLYGYIKFLMDQPINNGKPVKLSQHDVITGTVKGLLLSYYTAREKIIIRSINQIIYLLETDTKLDGSKKHLTYYAENLEKESKNKKQSNEKDIIEKINIIDRIFEIFLKSSPELEERIFRIESEALYKKWINEFQTRPVSKFIRLTEGFIRLFVDPINDPENFILIYDGKEYSDYFRDYPNIIEAADAFNFENFNLSGTDIKELLKFSIPPELNPKQFIYNITRIEIPKSAYSPSILLSKSTLQKISNRSYELAVRVNEVISYYYTQKEINHDDIKKNYDFFLNAVIKKTKTARAALILKKDEITLKDFLEGICSLSYHIAKELNHEGIDAMIKDKENLNKKIENLKNQTEEKDSGDADEFNDGTDIETDSAVLNEINSLYKDTLTGLWKYEYFEDQVIPKLYNENKNYKLENSRIIFLCEINGFKKINASFGHSAGDKILIEISKKIISSVTKPEMNKNNIAVKYEDCYIMGYLNDVSLLNAVDVFAEITAAIHTSHINLKTGDNETIDPALNTALYQERTGTNADYNISVAKKILAFVNEKTRNNIGFPKDINLEITERNFNRAGMIDDSVLTLYRK
jgi:diguanylate cyclase (GGDEF)-like protein